MQAYRTLGTVTRIPCHPKNTDAGGRAPPPIETWCPTMVEGVGAYQIALVCVMNLTLRVGVHATLVVVQNAQPTQGE